MKAKRYDIKASTLSRWLASPYRARTWWRVFVAWPWYWRTNWHRHKRLKAMEAQGLTVGDVLFRTSPVIAATKAMRGVKGTRTATAEFIGDME